jgi:hypothetical protein
MSVMGLLSFPSGRWRCSSHVRFTILRLYFAVCWGSDPVSIVHQRSLLRIIEEHDKGSYSRVVLCFWSVTVNARWRCRTIYVSRRINIIITSRYIVGLTSLMPESKTLVLLTKQLTQLTHSLRVYRLSGPKSL